MAGYVLVPSLPGFGIELDGGHIQFRVKGDSISGVNQIAGAAGQFAAQIVGEFGDMEIGQKDPMVGVDDKSAATRGGRRYGDMGGRDQFFGRAGEDFKNTAIKRGRRVGGIHFFLNINQ